MLRNGPGKGTDPDIMAAIDRRQIEAGLERTLDRALTLVQHEAGLASDPIGSGLRMPEDPAGGELLRELLEDKRTLTTERVFMILGLLYPNEDFQGILVGFGSPLSGDRASAQELIESLLPRDTANAVIGLASEGEPATRLALADPRRKESLEGYAETVRALLKHESRSVRALALYHAGEICLDCAAEDLPGGGGGESKASGQATTLPDRAIGLLRNLSEGPARRARSLLTSILAR